MSSKLMIELEPAIAKPSNKGGRPRKQIDQSFFEGLCKIQCTLEEIAQVLGVSEDTVERWCKRTHELGFADAYKKFSATGKTSLRRYQFEAAKKGNVTMQIWLGKQYLGQTDKPTPEGCDEEIDMEKLGNSLFAAMTDAAQRKKEAARSASQRVNHDSMRQK
jgi:hypothetical protein